MKIIINLCLSFLLAFQAQASDNRFDTMVVFGDSLSDNGNLYQYMLHIVPSTPPYYNGHFSNGPLWVEYLYENYFQKDHAQGLQDYAVGGAGAVLSRKQNLPFTITAELDDYLYLHTGNKETSLFTIWIGANNYTNEPTNVEDLTKGVVNAIGSVIERLIDKGGDKFLIMNLPDLARLPEAKKSTNQWLLTQLTLAHNQKLDALIISLREKYPTVTFVYFDAFTFFNESIERAVDYGFTKIDEPCYSGGYRGLLPIREPDDEMLYMYLKKQSPEMTLQQWEIIKDNIDLREAASASYIYSLLPAFKAKYPTQCDEYVFWDKVHPSTKIHKMIAEQVRIKLDEAGLQAIRPKKID